MGRHRWVQVSEGGPHARNCGTVFFHNGLGSILLFSGGEWGLTGTDTVFKDLWEYSPSGIGETGGSLPTANSVVVVGNIPNPFSSQTVVGYALPKHCEVNVSLFNTSGKFVRTLAYGTEKAGFHQVGWDGRDERGGTAPNGVYICRLRADGVTATRKLVKLD